VDGVEDAADVVLRRVLRLPQQLAERDEAPARLGLGEVVHAAVDVVEERVARPVGLQEVAAQLAVRAFQLRADPGEVGGDVAGQGEDLAGALGGGVGRQRRVVAPAGALDPGVEGRALLQDASRASGSGSASSASVCRPSSTVPSRDGVTAGWGLLSRETKRMASRAPSDSSTVSAPGSPAACGARRRTSTPSSIHSET
jgi:hypothetical protein